MNTKLEKHITGEPKTRQMNKALIIILILSFLLFTFSSDIVKADTNEITNTLEWQSCKNIFYSFMVWNNPNFLEGFYNVCGKLMYVNKP